MAIEVIDDRHLRIIQWFARVAAFDLTDTLFDPDIPFQPIHPAHSDVLKQLLAAYAAEDAAVHGYAVSYLGEEGDEGWSTSLQGRLGDLSNRAGVPHIRIKMLDGPPWAPHPASLNDLNFDDYDRAAMVGYAQGEGASAQ